MEGESRGRVASYCLAKRQERSVHMRANLIGRKFGRLDVVDYAEDRISA